MAILAGDRSWPSILLARAATPDAATDIEAAEAAGAWTGGAPGKRRTRTFRIMVATIMPMISGPSVPPRSPATKRPMKMAMAQKMTPRSIPASYSLCFFALLLTIRQRPASIPAPAPKCIAPNASGR